MDALRGICTGRAERDYPLAPLTTFRVGGPADWFFEPGGEEEIGPLLAALAKRALPVTILGEGSNILVRDGGIRGAVLHIGRPLAWLEWDGELARCGAGLSSRSLAKRALEAGRGGFEWAAALPGNLGGAVRGNAGAFGGDMAGIFDELEGFDFDGRRRRLGRDEVRFGYRHSSLPADLVVTRLALRLPPLCEEDLRASRLEYEEVLKRRASTQPGGLFTAGSTFANPPGDAAGRLIDACGLKGRRVGGARVSERHANFIEATGEAVCAADIEALMDLMAAEVLARTGIALEREIRVHGDA